MAVSHAVQYGKSTIGFEIYYAQRKTLGISVHPDLRVTVAAPENTTVEQIEQKVRKRAPWILRQRRQFMRYLPGLPPRQYVSGETHRYLGRQYRLKVLHDADEKVKLSRGRIFIHVRDKNDIGRVKHLLDQWYREHAKRVFTERLDATYERVQWLAIPYPRLAIRVMKSRWGSCSQSGTITLNIKLIQVPKQYIDYVIVHELCHLKERNHSKRYYELLDRVMPDWSQRKRRLNEFEFA